MHSEAMNDPVADRLPGSGVALMLAGVLLAGINLVLTPQLGIDRDFAAVAASTVFFTRQLIASGIALLVLYGLIGLRETHAGVPGKFGVVAFALAFLGTAVLLPLEWGQAFIIHDMALAAPAGLEALENQDGFSLFDLSAAISAGGFMLGWLVYSGWMLKAGQISKAGPGLVLGGFLAIPLLVVAIGPLWGQIIGSVAAGAGWVMLGRAVRSGS